MVMRSIFGKFSVQGKLAAIVIAICVTLLLAMASLFIYDKVVTYRRSMVENHAMLIETIAGGSMAALVFDDAASADETLAALSGVRDVEKACIYRADGSVFATYIKASESEPDSGAVSEELKEKIDLRSGGKLAYDFTNQYLDLAAPIIFEDHHIGYITMRADLRHLNNRLLGSIAVILILIVLLGFMAQLASIRLHRAIAEPLMDLLDTMEAVRRDKTYSYRVRKLHDDEFGALSDGFNSMLAEIEARDAELSKYRDHLEILVSRRTKELLYSNQELQAEIEERKVIQGQLARAQRMEAIGTLAGGVAHDLNNILSGIVSYPELLLMNIDDKHEMYRPLKTIQTSGTKAAAIVQDLLTLARRGGMSSEVIRIGTVVRDYLGSPECAKMLENHAGVKITVEEDEEIFNIWGSAVHIGKTVMNLVTNGAEAIADEGEIVIRLYNCHLVSPVKGYDRVEKGNYVLLQVTDTGHGIPAEDLQYIFEPFYTKKKMGISGTGLGMAVVWGTVEDHKGYIDVDSRPGHGSTFSLYFPATTEEISREDLVKAERYQGRGERILVVDDIREQRIIATAILERMGYTVESAGSGEEAVEKVREKRFDLLLLDMIMEPGIDGIATLRKVQEIYPDQRVIVASGYSEANKFEAARRLGVAASIRKPYTVAGIARIVREELDRRCLSDSPA